MKKKLFMVLSTMLLCISLTACSVKFGTPPEKEDPKPTTIEEKEEDKDEDKEEKGFDSSEDAITAYWQAFADVKKSAFRECFPDPDDAKKGAKTNLEDTVQAQYDLAKKMQDSIDVFLDDIEMDKATKVDVDDIDTLENVNPTVAEAYDIEKLEVTNIVVPMEQTVETGDTYLVNDEYEVVTARIDGRWYIITITETNAYVVEDPTTTVEDPTEEDPTTTVGDPVSVEDTDYSKVNWGVTYSPIEDMPGVTISVTPMVDDCGTYTLILGVTNMYNVPINFSGQANAKDAKGNYIGDAFIYLSSIGYGNTSIATIYCPDGVPNGEIHWDELKISEGYSEYVPWAADWDASAPDANTLELSYSVTMTESTNPGDVYGLILDDKGFVIDVFHDYVSDKGTTVSSSTSKYRKDITKLGVSDVALFINPTK